MWPVMRAISYGEGAAGFGAIRCHGVGVNWESVSKASYPPASPPAGEAHCLARDTTE